MKKLSVAEYKQAFSEMQKELKEVKLAAEEFEEELKDTKPEDVSLDNEYEGEDLGKEPEEGKEDHPVEIKTPEDAKKVLDEAKEDIQQVVDNLEGVIGEGEEGEDKVDVKRINEATLKSYDKLQMTASKAIDDANDALNHWAFLKNRIKEKKASKIDLSDITDPNLRQVASTVHQVGLLEKALNKIGFIRKDATAVPPTGAKFTGDEWPNGKNPAEVELRHWEAGASEFKKDKKKDDSLVNPAMEDRLIDAGNPHDDKPFVNASLNLVNDPILGKGASYWEVYDGKTGKAFKVAFADVPPRVGPKDERGFGKFSSMNYGKTIMQEVKGTGIEQVKTYLNGTYINSKTASLNAEAKDPNVKDKKSLRSYYSEAFGDPAYARELTSGKENDKMDIGYKPKDDKVKESDTKVKDGPGKMSSKEDPKVLEAKAKRVTEIAMKAAAAGNIEFNKTSIKEYASKLLKKSSLEVQAIEETLDDANVYNQEAYAALTNKTAHIPDTENGIVGNTSTGVSEPKSEVKTEDMNKDIEGDAKIASIVPQMSKSASNTGFDISNSFTTVVGKLQEKGVNLTETRIRTPKYR